MIYSTPTPFEEAVESVVPDSSIGPEVLVLVRSVSLLMPISGASKYIISLLVISPIKNGIVSWNSKLPKRVSDLNLVLSTLILQKWEEA